MPPNARSSSRSAPRRRAAFDRVLVATDFSAASRRALLFVSRLSREVGRVRLLHVVDPGPYGTRRLVAEISETIRRRLDAEATALRRRGMRCDTRVVLGGVERTILEEAARWGAAAIVCGTHGRRGLDRLLLGSVAGGLLGRARCPVLVVPHAPTPRAIHRVVLATDFSGPARAAFDLAVEFCRAPGRALRVVHVVDTAFASLYSFATHPGFFDEASRRRGDAARRLEAAGRALSRAGIAHRTVLERGDPSERILREADREDTHLLILGSRGLGRLRRALLGSVARRVVRGSPYAVLVVPPRR